MAHLEVILPKITATMFYYTGQNIEGYELSGNIT